MTEITIVATTWMPPGNEEARMAAVVHAILSWNEKLQYDDTVNLHLADDGSKSPWFEQLVGWAKSRWNGKVTTSQQQRRGVGASLNAGIYEASKCSPLILHAVDDWELLAPFDLNPWANFLLDPHYDVGMVRFFPHPDLTGTVRFVPPHGWAMALDRHHFSFGFRPALFHTRFFKALGSFDEGVSSFDAEELYNQRANVPPIYEGQRIWLALPDMWRPIETGSLAGVVPGG